MGRQILKQPDGLYAEYSTIVNGFVMMNATAEQIIERARKEAADEAERLCWVAINDANAGKIPFLGVTWNEAVKNHNKL